MGLVEFFEHRNIFVDIFPRGMLQQLIENNPNLAMLLPDDANHFRNGLYRAESAFVTPLSFGEFEIIVIPIGLFFALYRRSSFEKSLGWATVFGGIIGIFCSGSRGGYIGVLFSVAVFVAVWSIRKAVDNKASLAPAIVGLTGVVSFTFLIGLILFWKRAHNIVLGGGDAAASNQGRYAQWVAGIPLIRSNPITGHGFAAGGYVINSSIDSYVLSVLLETGIPGLVFFVGLAVLLVRPAKFCLRHVGIRRGRRGAGLQFHRLLHEQTRSVAARKSYVDLFSAGDRRDHELRIRSETSSGASDR